MCFGSGFACAADFRDLVRGEVEQLPNDRSHRAGSHRGSRRVLRQVREKEANITASSLCIVCCLLFSNFERCLFCNAFRFFRCARSATCLSYLTQPGVSSCTLIHWDAAAGADVTAQAGQVAYKKRNLKFNTKLPTLLPVSVKRKGHN